MCTDPDSRRAAAQWARRAAANAWAARAYDDSARLLSEALADMTAADGDSVERAEVLIELAHAEYLAGRYDRCLECCVDAADAAAGSDRGDLVARSALALQNVTYPQAGEVLSRLCRRALTYPRLGVGLRARVLAQLATVEADSGRVGQAGALVRESLALAAQSADPLAEIEAAHAREMTLVYPDDTAERMPLGDLVADRAEALGLPLAALMGHEWRITRRTCRPGDAGDEDYRKQRLSQSSVSWAISCQPWSIVRECPRSANSRKSVIAGDLW